MQITAKIAFEFPLKEKTVRNLQLVTTERGTLEVEAEYAIDESKPPVLTKERYQARITSAKFNGAEVLPVLQAFGNYEEVQEAGVYHAAMHDLITTGAVYPTPAKKEVAHV